MARDHRYKCRCCKDYFTPDRRNRGRQHYCSLPTCRAASKKASQRKWTVTKGRAYFKGPTNVGRVRRWRKDNPGYARGASKVSKKPLQDPLNPQLISQKEVKASLDSKALQDSYISQDPLMIGLIAHLVGGPEDTLQDSMEAVARHYTRQGQRLMDQGFSIQGALGGLSDEHQKIAVPGAATSAASTIQLDRSAVGTG